MAKIRYLNFLDLINLRKLIKQLSDNSFFNYKKEVLIYPLKLINTILPPDWKFTNESYIASMKNEIKAMVTISPRKNNTAKWRISQLLLDKNSYDIGEQLINYVASKYGAKGVETVETNIESNNLDMIDLFAKACKFRYCSDYQIFEIKKEFFNNQTTYKNCVFRPFKNTDAEAVSDLYNTNISPYYKFSLSKIKNEFYDEIFTGLSKNIFFKYIIEDKYTKQLRGYLQIETGQNRNFIIDIFLLESFENYFEDVINFAHTQINKRSKNSRIYFRNNKFHINSGYFEEYFKKTEAELIQTEMIFVKDFYRQIKDEKDIKNSIITYDNIKGKPVYKI